MKMISRLLLTVGLVLSATTVSAQALKFGHYVSPSDFRGKTVQKFADIINQKGNDKITVNVYPNESLVKGRDSLQATARGTADLYSVFAGYITGSIGLMKVFTFPFPSENYTDQKLMEFANDPEVVEILGKALDSNNIKLLGFINTTGNTTAFFRRPFNGLSDFKGIKIRGVGGYSDVALEELQASIIFMSAAEQFLQLETGGVDAVITTESSYINQDLASVAPYVLNDVVVRGPYALIMNKRKWARLDEESQKQIMETVAETIEWSNKNVTAENEQLALAMKAKAKEFYSFTSEEREELKKVQQKAIDLFIKEYGEDAKRLVEIHKKYQ